MARVPALPPLRFLSPLHRATRRIGAALERPMAELKLGSSEAHLLAYLLSYAPCPIGDLRRVFGFSPSTLTSILDRLERDGAVARRLNRRDRRSLVVELTPEGRRLGAGVRRAVEELEARIGARVDAAGLEGFRAVIAAIEAATAESSRKAPGGTRTAATTRTRTRIQTRAAAASRGAARRRP